MARIANALTTVLVEATSPSTGAVQRAVRSANAQAQVTQRFSWTATARHMVGHYESVTTQPYRRS